MTCVNGKRRPIPPNLRPVDLPSGTVEERVSDWVERLARHHERVPAVAVVRTASTGVLFGGYRTSAPSGTFGCG